MDLLILLALLCTIKQQSKTLISLSFKKDSNYHFIGRPKENGKTIKRVSMNPHPHVVILQQFHPCKATCAAALREAKFCKVMTLSESCVVEPGQFASAS